MTGEGQQASSESAPTEAPSAGPDVKDAATLEASSGERFHPGAGIPENAYEHWHRYLWARAFCDGRRVLDVASGEGYGSFLLASVARSVVGVDVSAAAVEHARTRYRAGNLEYLVGRAEELPISGPARFDIVVSFETIEHLGEAEQSRFLAEVKRVLVPGGTLLVSTPDREAYASELAEENEFHEREFSPPEFRVLLEGHFKHVHFLGQRIYPASYLWPMDPGTEAEGLDEHQLIETTPRELRPADGDRKKAVYVVAVCSDAELERSRRSLLLDTAQLAIRERIEEAVANRWHLEHARKELQQQKEELTGGLRMATQRAERAERGLVDAQEQIREVELARGADLKRAAARDAELIRTRDRLLAEEEERKAAEQRWQDFQRSRAAAVVRRLQQARARFAPRGTVPGRLLDLGVRGTALLSRQGLRGALARVSGRAGSEDGLCYSLDRNLPTRLEIGLGTELRISGWCYHEQDEVSAVELLVDVSGCRSAPSTSSGRTCSRPARQRTPGRAVSSAASTGSCPCVLRSHERSRFSCGSSSAAGHASGASWVRWSSRLELPDPSTARRRLPSAWRPTSLRRTSSGSRWSRSGPQTRRGLGMHRLRRPVEQADT